MTTGEPTASSRPAVLLASTSRWRLGLLRDAGVPCEAVDSGVDERAIRVADPVELARARALAKAEAVAARQPGVLVIGTDQVMHLDGQAFGKPASPEAWREQLRLLRGRWHHLTTAVALACRDASSAGGREDSGGWLDASVELFDVTSRVRLRADLTDAELDAYVALGEAAGCAGGYMVERRGAWLVEAVDGDWLNVIGLPVLPLIGRLRARGWRLGAAGPVAPRGITAHRSGSGRVG